jgi:hypothetical protein
MSVPIGILAALQLAFALTWVIYVIYLPSLAAQAGVPKHAVAWILLMDQVIFIACDWMAGIYADRVARALGRVGPRLAIAALVSCAAFLLLPWIAPAGSSVAFIALTALWSATSSALCAPPLTLTGRHATHPERPWIAAVYMLGLGLAAAAAPYLGTRLRGIDPRIPFTISTAMVIIATFALVAAERRLRADRPVMPQAPRAADGRMLAMFAVAVALFAIGFQLHFSVNSSRQYLRFAAPEELESLMPVFWIGFNLAMLPAALITRRFGGLVVMTAGGVAAMLLSAAVPFAPSLGVLAGLQFAAGAAWGFVLMSAFTAALEVGAPGLEGRITGMLFSMLAVAAFARIAFVSAGVPGTGPVAEALPALPAFAWLLATAITAAIAMRMPRRGGLDPV